MKVNASMMKTWATCPLQAKFREVENRPRRQNAKASFGTIVHDALDLYNQTGSLHLAHEAFKHNWAHPEALNVAPDSWPKGSTYGSLRQKGVEILTNYDTKNKWEKREIIATEHKFCVYFGEHELSGVVDLLEEKKSSKGHPTLRVIDFKTNTKRPIQNILRMDIQFTSYVWASLQPEFWLGFEDDPKYPPLVNGEELYERYRNADRKAIWYHLWDNKELSVGDRDDNDFLRLYRCVCEIAKAVERDVYVPNISGDSCVWCDYTDICKAVIPVRDKVGSPKPGDEDLIF